MSKAGLYFVLAVLGAVIPMVFFSSYFLAEGIDIATFIAALFADGAVGGFTADLLISSFVFWVFMFSKMDSGPKPWLFISLNLCVGLSCALPAYLWAAEKVRVSN